MRRLALVAASVPLPALAHGAEVHAWKPDPIALGLLVLGAVFYARGLARLWARAGAGRGLSLARAGAFVGGLAITAGLLFAPLESLAGRALWAHMIQHCGLMLVAAPLLILGRPGLAVLWALPPAARSLVGRVGTGRTGTAWRWLTAPLGAGAGYFAVLWVWHVPALHELALINVFVHALQHATFIAGAMLLWTALIDRSGAAAIVLAFATMVHSVALAALLTVSEHIWYPAYAGAWGIDGLADQQLAGLIMWVPGCIPLVGAAMWALLATLREAGLRARRSVP